MDTMILANVSSFSLCKSAAETEGYKAFALQRWRVMQNFSKNLQNVMLSSRIPMMNWQLNVGVPMILKATKLMVKRMIAITLMEVYGP